MNLHPKPANAPGSASAVIERVDLRNDAQLAEVVELLDMYSREPMGAGGPLAPDVRARLPSLFRQQPGTHLFLARVAGRAVGLAVCFQGISSFHARPLLNIHDLAVHPNCRGQGVGEALLIAVEQLARELGCCRLTLEVRDDNPARRLYTRFGFSGGLPGSTAEAFWKKALS